MPSPSGCPGSICSRSPTSSGSSTPRHFRPTRRWERRSTPSGRPRSGRPFLRCTALPSRRATAGGAPSSSTSGTSSGPSWPAPARTPPAKASIMKRFDNRTVITTGGARGMGASHARGFVAEGANVVIADVLEQEGRTLADELGDHAIFSHLDVTSDRDWAATVASAEDTFGPVSVLVNNAGIVRFGVLAETEPAVWHQVMDVNVTGPYLGIRAVTSSMRKAGGGAIVNISSGAGFTATFGLAAYVSSKWAVRGLTKTAALELGSDNIRVNSVHPGAIRTPILAGDAPDAAAMAGAGVGLSAIPRIAEPDEITRMVL